MHRHRAMKSRARAGVRKGGREDVKFKEALVPQTPNLLHPSPGPDEKYGPF